MIGPPEGTRQNPDRSVSDICRLTIGTTGPKRTRHPDPLCDVGLGSQSPDTGFLKTSAGHGFFAAINQDRPFASPKLRRLLKEGRQPIEHAGRTIELADGVL